MDDYTVYEHVFPNGKRYIGITSTACETRWRNGEGYKTQRKIHNAIQKYGWENIEHNVIVNGINNKQAKRLEKYLIQSLNTIKDGYNTAIGGENINTCYLNKYVLAMLRYAKRNDITSSLKFDDGDVEIVKMVDGDRYDKSASDMWNEASEAVIKKHGRFSPTACRDVSEYWWYMNQYYVLWLMMQMGMDVTGWEETPFENRGIELAESRTDRG
jgi:hypothetical protein